MPTRRRPDEATPAMTSFLARREHVTRVGSTNDVVRDWLAANWDRTGTPPELPADIVERTADRYRELIARITA